MEISNIRSEKKILEKKLLKLISDFEDSTNTEVSEISIKRTNPVGKIISVIELNVNVKV